MFRYYVQSMWLLMTTHIWKYRREGYVEDKKCGVEEYEMVV